MAKALNSSAETARRNWIIAGVGVCLIATVTLVAFAMTRGSTDEASLTRSTLTPAATLAPAPGPTVEPSAAPAAASAVPPTRLISALDADTAWRTVTGECPTSEAALERTDDRGATWEPFSIFPDTDARSVSVLQAADSDFIYIVGQRGSDCSPMWVGTFTGGDDWREFPTQLPDTWYVDDSDRSVIYAPGGASTVVCESVASLAVTSSTEAAALCNDQTLFRTGDGGSTWDAALPVPGAVSLDNSDAGYVVALLAQPECAGIQIREVGLSAADDDSTAPLGCLQLEQSQIDAGTPAVSFADGALWLWAGDTVRTSLDAGVTW